MGREHIGFALSLMMIKTRKGRAGRRDNFDSFDEKIEFDLEAIRAPSTDSQSKKYFE